MNDEKPAQAFACAGSVFEKFGIAVERQTAGELREQALHIGAVVFVIRRGKVFSAGMSYESIARTHVPLPSPRLSMISAPLCSCAMLLATARPMPLPAGRERLSRCLYFPKTVDSSSGGMPAPLSSTQTIRFLPVLSSETAILPPRLQLAMPFDRRLSTSD